MSVANQSDSPREAGWTGSCLRNQTVELLVPLQYITQTAKHAAHVAGKAAFLWLVSHREGFGIHIRCGLAKRQAFPALDPLAGAGRFAL